MGREISASVDVGLPEFSVSVDAGLPELSASVDAGLPEFSASVDVGLPELSASVDVGLPELSASVDAGLPELSASFDAGLPKFSASFDAGLQYDAQGVEVAVECGVPAAEVVINGVEESVLFPADAWPTQPVVATRLLGVAQVGASIGLELEAPDGGEFTEVELAVENPLASGVVSRDMAFTAEVAEAHLEVDVSPALQTEICEYGAPEYAGLEANAQVGFEGEIPNYSVIADAELQQNAQEVEIAAEIPLVSGDVQPLFELAPTAEVTEAHLGVEASPALQSELCQYSAQLEAGLEPNMETVEVALNIQAIFNRQEVPPMDAEGNVLICAVSARALPGPDKDIQFFASSGLSSQPLVTTQLVVGAPVEVGVCPPFEHEQEVERAVEIPCMSDEQGGI